MRFVNWIIAGVLFIMISCDTEGDQNVKNYFIRYYGEDGDHEAADMVINSDGSIVVLGTSEFPANSGNRRIYLAKIDELNNTTWEKHLGNFAENAQDIEPILMGTYAGGFLIISNPVVDVDGNTEIKVLRVTSEGEKVDSLMIDDVKDATGNYSGANAYSVFAHSITPLQDGGFIITGNTKNNNLILLDNGYVVPDQEDQVTLRYSESKALVWQSNFGNGPEEMGIKVFQENATKFNYAGYTNATHSSEPDAASNYDLNFSYLSLNGSGVNSSAVYSGSPTEGEKMNSIAKTPFGDYIAVGSVNQSGGAIRVFVSRVVGNFSTTDKDQSRTFDGEGISICPSGGSNVLVVGNHITTGGSRDIWLTKMSRDFEDQEGFPVTFGASGDDDTASAVAELPNGDIVVLGTMNLVNQNKIALIRLKANGGF